MLTRQTQHTNVSIKDMSAQRVQLWIPIFSFRETAPAQHKSQFPSQSFYQELRNHVINEGALPAFQESEFSACISQVLAPKVPAQVAVLWGEQGQSGRSLVLNNPCVCCLCSGHTAKWYRKKHLNLSRILNSSSSWRQGDNNSAAAGELTVSNQCLSNFSSLFFHMHVCKILPLCGTVHTLTEELQ